MNPILDARFRAYDGAMSPVTKYSIARLTFFLVPFLVAVWLGIDVVFSALIGTGVALVLSLVALRKLRGEASAQVGSWKTRAGKGEYDQDMAREDNILFGDNGGNDN
jgi:hypothetical protein